VFLSGIGRGRSSYKKFISLTPSSYDLHFLNSTFLMHDGHDRAIGEIENFLDRNRLEAISLAGHSLGGGLAILYASSYPKRVKHLYLLDSIGINEQKSFVYHMVHFLRRPINEAVKDLKVLPTAIKHPMLLSKLSYYVRSIDLQNEAANIKVPTIIIWGEKDVLIPVRHARKLANLIKKSKVIILPKVGHDWPVHNPELFWENIKNG